MFIQSSNCRVLDKHTFSGVLFMQIIYMNFSTDYIFTFWAINTVWYIYNSTNVLLKKI